MLATANLIRDNEVRALVLTQSSRYLRDPVRREARERALATLRVVWREDRAVEILLQLAPDLVAPLALSAIDRTA